MEVQRQNGWGMKGLKRLLWQAHTKRRLHDPSECYVIKGNTTTYIPADVTIEPLYKS